MTLHISIDNSKAWEFKLLKLTYVFDYDAMLRFYTREVTFRVYVPDYDENDDSVYLAGVVLVKLDLKWTMKMVYM